MRRCNQFRIVLFVCSIFVTLGLSGCKKTQKITIGFYSSSEVIEKNLEELIKSISSENQIKPTFVKISQDTSLEEQIKKNKISAIITPAGTTLKNTLEAADKSSAVSFELTEGMFSTMKQATVTENKKAAALPLLIDHLEIDIDSQSFMDSGMKAINTWKDIEKFCKIQQKRVDGPIAFTGNDSVFFLDLLGAITEALSGVESYDRAVEILNSEENIGENFDANAVVKKLFSVQNAPLSNTEYYLRKLISAKYVNPVVREFTGYDIDVMAQDRRARVIFTTLSAHRSYNPQGIARYSTMYMPSKFSPDARHFTANVTYFVPVKNNPATETILQNLYSPDYQGELSRRTGLSPVLAQCRTPDKQADDVRYWISATGTPLAGLGHETKLSTEQLKLLKDEILGLIF